MKIGRGFVGGRRRRLALGTAAMRRAGNDEEAR